MPKPVFVILQITLVIILILGGVAGFKYLKSQKKSPEKETPPPLAPLVRVEPVAMGEHPVQIRAEGTVGPRREVKLVPQVSGRLIFVADDLKDGGFFKKGDLLARIEPRDYELAVTLAKAKVLDAESALSMTREEAAIAREEWRAHLNIPDGQESEIPPLVAKAPQLAAAQAGLQAMKAELDRAKLNLSRTELTAPFDGLVISESVEAGQYVAPGQVLATLVSTEAAEIPVPMELDDLAWINVPGFTTSQGEGSPATVTARLAGRTVAWPGRVVRAQAMLDPKTRMAKVIVRVEKPYDMKPPLAMGMFVTISITGRTLDQAALVPRAALRGQDTVWVVEDENRLVFRKVTKARSGVDGVVVTEGLSHGDLVVTSQVKAPTDGMAVRLPKKNGEAAAELEPARDTEEPVVAELPADSGEAVPAQSEKAAE